MNKYSEMSDFEVNKSVAVCIGYQTGWKAGGSDSIGIADGSAFGTYVDYCNNPSDAWPIIVENKISIFYDMGECNALSDSYIEMGGQIFGEKWHSDKNPLRAAMIVFLMMKDKDNDNKE